jgi:hypothetical protein
VRVRLQKQSAQVHGPRRHKIKSPWLETRLRAFHKTRADSSEKTAENSALPVDSPAPRPKRFAMTEAMQAACGLLKTLGLVPSFRNLYIVELAIKSESNFSSISIPEAAERIAEAARICRDEMHQCIDYFWFEDACWRQPKLSFSHQDELRMRDKARWY